MNLRALWVTPEYPSAEQPDMVPFVAQQADFVRRAGAEVDVLRFRAEANPLNYLRGRRELRRCLRGGSYDLVHAHFGQTGLVAFPSALPTIVTFYGSDLEGIVGADGGYTVLGALLRRVSRGSARLADGVVVVSRSLARHLPPGVHPEILPLGLDLELFRPGSRPGARHRLGFQDDRPLVLFSGNPAVPVKRHGLAVEAMERLGGGTDLVTVTGVSREVVRSYMNACDVLLVTSRHEGAPAMVKEALACDLPVVSVDVGDVREWIGGLEGCVVCADDRPETIADALRSVLDRREPFHGRAAVAEADERLIAERIVELYAAVVGETEVARP